MTVPEHGSTAPQSDYDVVVVGAGFGGMAALYQLRQRGLSVVVLEADSEVGGTWHQNRYPGARCDVESLDYSFSFSDELQQEWEWTERYAAQGEILDYLRHVANRFDLRRDIRFDSRVVSAIFNAQNEFWELSIESGERVTARYCVMAVGALSASQLPDIPGIERFSGEQHHTADWPQTPVDFAGKRVGIIGTGSSGVQLTPIVAQSAAQLTVFQRTANFVIPLRNCELDEVTLDEWRRDYTRRREIARHSSSGHNQAPNPLAVTEMTPAEARDELERRWVLGGMYMLRAFNDQMTNPEANELVADFVRAKIREVVRDAEVADLLTPRGFPFGAKRLCCGTGYYEAFNRDNVELVSVSSAPITEITEAGIRTNAREYPLDVIIFATGFDAFTGPFFAMDVRGVDGRSLHDAWAEGPRSYLGLMTAGFPNMFMIAAAGSPSVLASVVTTIELHAEWIADCVASIAENGGQRIEATADAEAGWREHLQEVAATTLYLSAGNSWYLGANTPGKPQVFMPYAGGFSSYREQVETATENDFAGFAIT